MTVQWSTDAILTLIFGILGLPSQLATWYHTALAIWNHGGPIWRMTKRIVQIPLHWVAHKFGFAGDLAGGQAFELNFIPRHEHHVARHHTDGLNIQLHQ